MGYLPGRPADDELHYQDMSHRMVPLEGKTEGWFERVKAHQEAHRETMGGSGVPRHWLSSQEAEQAKQARLNNRKHH